MSIFQHATLTAVATAIGLSLSAPAQAAISFVNGIALSGGAIDQSGGTTVNDGRVGYFSDIYYDTNRNEWWGLSDRGPGGGTLDYGTRMQRFTLDVDLNTGAISNYQLVQTVQFTSGGLPLNGIAPSPTSTLGKAFDPEGVVVNPLSGNFLVSDEYGPSLYEFDRSGNMLRAFTTPANLVPRNSSTGTPNFAGDTGNDAGKRNNRGFEGLAISPDGQYAFAMLQSAMLDEGGSNGKLNRIVKFDIATGQAVAQYAYEMKRSSQGQGISALVAINDHEFFVLERNNLGLGAGAALTSGGGSNVGDKEVYKIDLTGATDVTGIDLDSGASFTKVSKSAKVIDLDANTIDLDGDGLVEAAGKTPEKWEGLAIGPRLNDGSYLMLAGNDNDYSVTQNPDTGTQYDVYFRFTDADPYAGSIQCPLDQTTGCFTTASSADSDGYDTTTAASLTSDYRLLPGVLHAYKASAADLAGYTTPVPEASSHALALSGLAVLGALVARRRKA